MVRQTCPNAARVRGFPHVLCRLNYGEKEPESTTERAKSACDCQYFCPQSKTWELRVDARECPKRGKGR